MSFVRPGEAQSLAAHRLTALLLDLAPPHTVRWAPNPVNHRDTLLPVTTPSPTEARYAREFERVQAVLRGESVTAECDAIQKVLWILLDAHGTDSWVDARSFGVRIYSYSQRFAHMYQPRFAAGVLADLLSQMGLARLTHPAVGYLDPRRAKLAPLGLAYPKLVAWIVPAPDRVQMFFRALGEHSPPETGPIPAEGLWRLPDPSPAWQPAVPVYTSFEHGLECPHCGRDAQSYRDLDHGVLVCRSCARSFKR